MLKNLAKGIEACLNPFFSFITGSLKYMFTGDDIFHEGYWEINSTSEFFLKILFFPILFSGVAALDVLSVAAIFTVLGLSTLLVIPAAVIDCISKSSVDAPANNKEILAAITAINTKSVPKDNLHVSTENKHMDKNETRERPHHKHDVRSRNHIDKHTHSHVFFVKKNKHHEDASAANACHPHEVSGSCFNRKR